MFEFREIKHAKVLPKGRSFILAGDIGGTNSNFAIFEEKELKLLLSFHFKSQQITNFTEVVKFLLTHLKSGYNIVIKIACFAAACPIHETGQYCSLTNTHWDVDTKKIQKKTGLSSLVLINDFEAIAYGLDVIKSKDYQTIKVGRAVAKKPRILIGAGTGLGKSIIIWNNTIKKYMPLGSEGGHSDISINSKEEFNFLRFFKQSNVEWEDVLSGKGISNIYKFISRRSPRTMISDEIKRSNYDPELISKYRETDSLSQATFKWFIKFYGRCAKNLALDALAQGGVFIAGGIAAKNSSIFKSKEFKQEFLNSKKQKKLLEKIPIYLITNYDVSLYGAAVAALLHKRGII